MWKELLQRNGYLTWGSPEARERRQKEEQALRERHRQEEEQYAEDLIYLLYINFQVNYSQLAQQMREQAHKASQLTLDSSRESLARIRFDAMRRNASFSDELLQTGEEQILALVQSSPEKKADIRLKALGKALNYWQDRLIQPDLTPDEMIFGRQRATQIQTRLEVLSNPNKGSDIT